MPAGYGKDRNIKTEKDDIVYQPGFYVSKTAQVVFLFSNDIEDVTTGPPDKPITAKVRVYRYWDLKDKKPYYCPQSIAKHTFNHSLNGDVMKNWKRDLRNLALEEKKTFDCTFGRLLSFLEQKDEDDDS